MQHLERICFIGLSLAVSFKGLAQDKALGCKQKVLECIQKMADHPKPKKGRLFYFKIKTRVVYSQKLNVPASEITSEIIIGNELAINRSNLYSIFVDNKNQFLVLHPQKLVNWSLAPTGLDKDSLFNITSHYQDSLISSSIEKQCFKSSLENHDLLTGVFEPNSRVKSAFGVQKLAISINLDKNRIWSVTNYFDGLQGVYSQNYTYQLINYNYKGKTHKTADRYVLGLGGGLNSKFIDYQLIDLRNNEELGVR